MSFQANETYDAVERRIGRRLVAPRLTPMCYQHNQAQVWHPHYRRYVCLPCGRRSGKTDMAITHGIRESLVPYHLMKPDLYGGDVPRFGFGATVGVRRVPEQ